MLIYLLIAAIVIVALSRAYVDLTVTAANVIPASDAVKEVGTAGEAVGIGVSVYKKSGDKRWYKSDADADEDDAIGYGITLTQAAAAAQPLVVQTGGGLGFGAILTVGTRYCVGEAAGGIAPEADVEAGERRRGLGIATTTSNLRVEISYLNTDQG